MEERGGDLFSKRHIASTCRITTGALATCTSPERRALTHSGEPHRSIVIGFRTTLNSCALSVASLYLRMRSACKSSLTNCSQRLKLSSTRVNYQKCSGGLSWNENKTKQKADRQREIKRQRKTDRETNGENRETNRERSREIERETEQKQR